jgi:threonine/homoserine/homoserine lactone efflux protein
MLPMILRGIAIGFSIAAPVGPIGVLCIRRSLAEGRLAGLVSGLGAATADAVYGSIAGFGLTVVTAFLIDQTISLRIIGGAFLLYLGVKTFFAQPVRLDEDPSYSMRKSTLRRDYLSTFFLTLTNPLTILSFAAIFAGLGIGMDESSSYLSAGVLVLGVFLGSAFWWLLLSWIASLFRNKLNSTTLTWVNRLSGGIIFIFGILAFASLYAFLKL